MNELDIQSTERTFVTSVDETSKTFFAQFCKFSLEELLAFNDKLDSTCKKIYTEQGPPVKVNCGDSYCCKFTVDGRWYRSKIVGFGSAGKCKVVYTDYGNSDTVSLDDLVLITPELMPEIERAPFGITCSLSNSNGERAEHLEKILKCLANRYVMFKVLGRRKEEPIWDVELARHAYNMPVWLTFKPNLLKDRTWRSGHWKIVHA